MSPSGLSGTAAEVLLKREGEKAVHLCLRKCRLLGFIDRYKKTPSAAFRFSEGVLLFLRFAVLFKHSAVVNDIMKSRPA